MAAGPMKKSEVIAHVAEAADVPPKVATKMLEALTDLASAEAKKGFNLPGLVKLVLVNRKARTGRNPTTGAAIIIPAKRVVKSRSSSAAKGVILGRARGNPAATQTIPTIKALHDPDTGRVDAVRVARYLNESLVFMASALGRNYSTVAKTPAAVPLQERLRDFKRIIEVLDHVFGGSEGTRIWMNTPHPDLDDQTPRYVIASGNVAVVRRMIDSSLSGNLS
jgi:DNA-binding protein HU-beta